MNGRKDGKVLCFPGRSGFDLDIPIHIHARHEPGDGLLLSVQILLDYIKENFVFFRIDIWMRSDEMPGTFRAHVTNDQLAWFTWPIILTLPETFVNPRVQRDHQPMDCREFHPFL